MKKFIILITLFLFVLFELALSQDKTVKKKNEKNNKIEEQKKPTEKKPEETKPVENGKKNEKKNAKNQEQPKNEVDKENKEHKEKKNKTEDKKHKDNKDQNKEKKIDEKKEKDKNKHDQNKQEEKKQEKDKKDKEKEKENENKNKDTKGKDNQDNNKIEEKHSKHKKSHSKNKIRQAQEKVAEAQKMGAEAAKPNNATTNKEVKKNKSVMDLFSVEWSQKMLDYESKYVYMIPCYYKEPQVFYENITQVPCTLRGAYILDESEKSQIDFKILSPSKTLVYSNNSAAAIFNVNVTQAGLYTIVFNNNYKIGEVKPTFTMNSGQNKIVKSNDLEKAEANMDLLTTFLKSFATEDKLKRNVLRERRKKLLKNNKYFYTFSVIESIVLVVVSIWQFYYMKNLFEIKGSL